MNTIIKYLEQSSTDEPFVGIQSYFQRLAVATVVQAIAPASAMPGEKVLVNENDIVEGSIGDSSCRRAIIDAVADALLARESRLIRIGPDGEWAPVSAIEEFELGGLAGGTLLVFIEPIVKQAA